MIVNNDMPGQSDRICHYGVIPNDAVMGNMHIRHDPIVVTDTGYATTLGRATIDRDKLTNGIIVANFQPSRFARVFFILWRTTDRRMCVNLVTRANPSWAFNNAMCANTATSANMHVSSNNRIRANVDARVNTGAGIDDCSWVDRHHAARSAQSISALATISPSTFA